MSSLLRAPTLSPSTIKGLSTDARYPPKYKLLLHNDKNLVVNYTAKMLVKTVKGLLHEEATQKTWEAFHKGISTIGEYPQDTAEDYCEKLRFNCVKSTVEPA